MHKVDKNVKLYDEYVKISKNLEDVTYLGTIVSDNHVIDKNIIRDWEKEFDKSLKRLESAARDLRRLKPITVKHLKKHEKFPLAKTAIGASGILFLSKFITKEGQKAYKK